MILDHIPQISTYQLVRTSRQVKISSLIKLPGCFLEALPPLLRKLHVTVYYSWSYHNLLARMWFPGILSSSSPKKMHELIKWNHRNVKP